jgi:WD40 repeat protein
MIPQTRAKLCSTSVVHTVIMEWIVEQAYGVYVSVRTGESSLPGPLISPYTVPRALSLLKTVYDVEIRKIVLNLTGHTDDVNVVCFADPLSPNVLFSGSDDSVVKVWDRRSMAGGRESGCLVGHMEGISFISSKGDGRYLISNGKDQTLKLWDIRKMMESSAYDALPRKNFTSGFDYRWMVLPRKVSI